MKPLRKPPYTLFQRSLKAWMQSTIRFFYRKIEVSGSEHLYARKEKPVIFASNHQNAFMDALVIIHTCRNIPSFLTRADIFQSRLSAEVLYVLRMLPIYRQRDGTDSLKRNEEVFDMCVQVLKDKDAMGIFPEGNHGRRPRLRPLKKGLARIALEAESRNDFSLDVKIFPVGINYSEHTQADSDVLVNYGQPISALEYRQAYQDNPVRAIVMLTQELRKRMEGLMIHISNQEYLDCIDGLRKMFGDELLRMQGENPRHLLKRFHSDKALVAALEAFIKEEKQAAAQLRQQWETYTSLLEETGATDAALQQAPVSARELALRLLLLLLTFPLYLYGAINNFILDYVPLRLARAFKDDHFHASVNMLGRMFVKPLMYLLQVGLVWLLVDDWRIALAYALSIQLSSWIARAWRRGYRAFNIRRKWYSMKQESREQLLGLRSELKDRLTALLREKELIKTDA
ncbi:MAG: hypothetical protein D6730_08895 [Bacteroidetes bacterium]|nr:MAG: hypothetical protein D6730_08895 [Bacteroidota bacterium]